MGASPATASTLQITYSDTALHRKQSTAVAAAKATNATELLFIGTMLDPSKGP
jgi:hypothetical protein